MEPTFPSQLDDVLWAVREVLLSVRGVLLAHRAALERNLNEVWRVYQIKNAKIPSSTT